MLTVSPDTAAEWRALRQRIAEADSPTQAKMLRDVADDTRSTIVRMIDRAQMGHVGGDFSVTDILTTLFMTVLSVDPERPDWAERDRFILSKGHCAAALYATLARCGFFDPAELDTFMAPLSPLNGHPDRTKVPGVETNTGPLGHGLPVAVGTALAGTLTGSTRRTVVVLGDGELQEGSNWEAAMSAAHHGLGRLTAVVDRNRLQQGARTEDTNALDPLPEKWRSFGWEVDEIDGHDFTAIKQATGQNVGDRPRCVIARTVKGRGVSFMEDRVEWHHKVPSTEQVREAIKELRR